VEARRAGGLARRARVYGTGGTPICLGERHQDILRAFISSKITGAANSNELDIPANHPQFQQSSLKVTSRCHLSSIDHSSGAPFASTEREAKTSKSQLQQLVGWRVERLETSNRS